ncbi:MAG: STAS domain-containing protein [Planctomycetaceae bacterium]|nr:STAS domain-containing protein [Phycisphaerales bacterium]MCE2653645.1 STAS domain-containing protein [Planctomycetaceae bacterium]
MSTLSVQEVRHADRVVVTMSGSADLANEAVLEREVNRLSAGRPGLIILDLSGLTFLASLALGQLLTLHRTVRSYGGSLKLVRPSPLVFAVLHRSKLDMVFEIIDSPAA